MIRWDTGVKRVATLAFSPDGRTLASATYRGQVVKLWRPDGAAVGRLPLGSPVRAAAFSPDGRRLAVGGEVAAVRLFHTADWSPAGELPCQPAGCSGLAFTPSGGLAALIGHAAHGWDPPAAGPPDRTVPLGHRFGGASSLAFAADGRLVTNGEDEACVWGLTAGGLLRTVPHPPALYVATRVSVSAAGWVAASYGRDIDTWHLDTAEPPRTLPGTKRSRSVRGLAFTPDGHLLAAGSDGLARLWDPAAGTLLREWDFALRNVQSVAVAPDGLTAAVGGADGSITVWDL